MGSPYSRLGIGISINGIVVVFLGYALLGDGEDFYLNVNRTYLALTMVAPLAILLLLAVSTKHSLAANSLVLGAFAALLIAVAVPPAPASVEERAVEPQEQTVPANSARY